MKYAILIRGASASGKSSTTNKFLESHPEYTNIHLDDFRRESGEVDHKAQREYAYKKGIEQLEGLVSEEKEIIIDEMFRPEFYKLVVEILEGSGYQIINVLMKTSLESLKERDASRKLPIRSERLETLASRAEKIEEQLKELFKGEQVEIDEDVTLEDGVKMIESAVESLLGRGNTEIIKTE